MRKKYLIILAAGLTAGCTAPEPYGALPSDAQVRWQRMEINMFCHFGPNTFTDVEWGDGREKEEVFSPTDLDCRQWASVAKQAGMGGIILTAKHHDGFCLWPSAYSSHTVAQSRWQEGRGDVLRTFVDACRTEGVLPGVYISPWDRNHPSYGTAAYNELFANTLTEVHQTYGPLFEQWFDGACGEGPNGRRQEYDWRLFEGVVAHSNAACVIFSDVGPGCRWVGNEQGYADSTNWSTLSVANGIRTTPHGGSGDKGGDRWIPAEVDVSIRPGWFWHADERPKSVEELMEIYYNSVGHNGLLLLNVPPDSRGRIPAEDSAALMAFRAERDRVFAHDLANGAHARAPHQMGHRASRALDTAYHTYWAAPSQDATITLTLDSATDFDIIVLQEYIPLGQRVTQVDLYGSEGGEMRRWTDDAQPLCTTVGYKRIIRHTDGGSWRTDKIALHFHAEAPPLINRIALYNSQRP